MVNNVQFLRRLFILLKKNLQKNEAGLRFFCIFAEKIVGHVLSATVRRRDIEGFPQG